MTAIAHRFLNIPHKIGKIADRRRWIVPLVFSLLLFLLSVDGLSYYNQLFLYDDEFGYWTASAYLTGTNWVSVSGGIPYYSYAYGFLILTPIRLLFSVPSTMYRAAIVVNGLMLTASYWIARRVSRKIFPEAHWFLLEIVCFLVMIYPSNIIFTHIAWAETILVFAFWIFVWLSRRVIEKPTIWNHIGIAFSVIWLYVIHQRTLAVAIATIMIMTWFFFIDKSRRKNVYAFAATMVILLVLHTLIKTDLIDTMYQNNSKVIINNIQGSTGRLKSLFTPDGFRNLFISMIGKWFYLFVATCMMAWWGAGTMFRCTFDYLNGLFIKKKEKRMQALQSSPLIWYTWLLLAIGGNFTVVAISMFPGSRNDGLVYGRYTEYMIGIYFIVGIMAFLKDDKWMNGLKKYIPITIVCAWFCQKMLDYYNLTKYQPSHSVCTSLFMENGVVPENSLYWFALVGTVLFVLAVLCLKAKPWKRFQWVRWVISFLAITVFYMATYNNMVFGRIVEKQQLRVINISSLVECIESIDADENMKVYYCEDTESRYWSESFQFLMGERPLTVIDSEDINLEENAFYIVGDDFWDNEEIQENFNCLKESYQFALLLRIGNP